MRKLLFVLGISCLSIAPGAACDECWCTYELQCVEGCPQSVYFMLNTLGVQVGQLYRLFPDKRLGFDCGLCSYTWMEWVPLPWPPGAYYPVYYYEGYYDISAHHNAPGLPRVILRFRLNDCLVDPAAQMVEQWPAPLSDPPLEDEEEKLCQTAADEPDIQVRFLDSSNLPLSRPLMVSNLNPTVFDGVDVFDYSFADTEPLDADSFRVAVDNYDLACGQPFIELYRNAALLPAGRYCLLPDPQDSTKLRTCLFLRFASDMEDAAYPYETFDDPTLLGAPGDVFTAQLVVKNSDTNVYDMTDYSTTESVCAGAAGPAHGDELGDHLYFMHLRAHVLDLPNSSNNPATSADPVADWVGINSTLAPACINTVLELNAPVTPQTSNGLQIIGPTITGVVTLWVVTTNPPASHTVEYSVSSTTSPYALALSLQAAFAAQLTLQGASVSIEVLTTFAGSCTAVNETYLLFHGTPAQQVVLFAGPTHSAPNIRVSWGRVNLSDAVHVSENLMFNDIGQFEWAMLAGNLSDVDLHTLECFYVPLIRSANQGDTQWHSASGKYYPNCELPSGVRIQNSLLKKATCGYHILCHEVYHAIYPGHPTAADGNTLLEWMLMDASEPCDTVEGHDRATRIPNTQVLEGRRDPNAITVLSESP